MEALAGYVMPDEKLWVQDFISLLDDYIASLDVRPTSKTAYRKGARYFLEWLLSQSMIQKYPTKEDAIRYKDHLTSTHKATTAASYLTAARSLCAYIRATTGTPNPFEGVKNPKSKSGSAKDALTADQARRLLASIPRETMTDKRDYAIVCLLLHTGLRTIEVSRANVDDMRRLMGISVLYVWGKGRDSRDDFVKLTSTCESAIRDYMTARVETVGALDGASPLFASTSNRAMEGRLTTRSISRICKSALRAAGFDSDRLTAHSLRHTAVTLALEAGAPLRKVQRMARHANPATTERYSHDLRRLEDSAEDAIESVLIEPDSGSADQS